MATFVRRHLISMLGVVELLKSSVREHKNITRGPPNQIQLNLVQTNNGLF